MNKITTAEIIKSDKRSRTIGGLYIAFNSEANVKQGDYVNLTYMNRSYPFKIVGVKVTGDLLEVNAREVGYFARKLDRLPNMDLRQLIGLEIVPVVDEAEIAKIREESLWN